MKELKRRGISCTCHFLSGDGGDKDGALAGKLYAFIIANPESLIRSLKILTECEMTGQTLFVLVFLYAIATALSL